MNAFCTCDICERTGLTKRIETAAHDAWSAKALQLNAAKRPVGEWLAEVNAADATGALHEATRVLAELESAFPTHDISF